MRLPVVAVIAIFLAAALATLAPVAMAELTVSTDKPRYMGGERVTITVASATPGRDVVVAVFNPRGDAVFVDQGPASANGIFTTSFTLPTTATAVFPIGTYTVKAQQDTMVANTTFRFETAAAFTIVTGRVVDEEGNPIEGATVKIVEAGVSTTTDANGMFTLNVDPGSYTLRVTAPNYLSNSTRITVVLGTNNVGTIQLTSFASLIARLQAQIANLSSQNAALQSQLSAISAQMAVLSAQLNATQAQVANLSSSLEALRADFQAAQAALSVALGNISSKLDSLSSDLRTGLSGVNTAIVNLSSAVSDIMARMAVLDNLNTNVAGLRTDITSLRNDISGLTNNLGQLSTRVDNINNALSGAISDFRTAMTNQLNALSSRIDSVSASVGSLNVPIIVAVIMALLAFVFALLTFLQVRRAMAAK